MMLTPIQRIAGILRIAYFEGAMTLEDGDAIREYCADLRRDFDKLKRERDEARRVARELAIAMDIGPAFRDVNDIRSLREKAIAYPEAP